MSVSGLQKTRIGIGTGLSSSLSIFPKAIWIDPGDPYIPIDGLVDSFSRSQLFGTMLFGYRPIVKTSSSFWNHKCEADSTWSAETGASSVWSDQALPVSSWEEQEFELIARNKCKE